MKELTPIQRGNFMKEYGSYLGKKLTDRIREYENGTYNFNTS